jgi:hypothetical protein
MNWAIVILAGVVAFAGLYYVIKGRHEYLLFSNSVMEDSVIVHGQASVSGRDAPHFGASGSENEKRFDS